MDKFTQTTVPFWEALKKSEATEQFELDDSARREMSDLQGVVAEALARAGGAATVEEVASSVGIPPSRVIRAGKGLEEKNLAEMKGSGSKVVVALTRKAGHRIL